MGKFYTWTKEELGLNVVDMDKEHQVLIDKMNVLYDLVEAKAPFEKSQVALTDLANYTVKHFKDEEVYMEKIGYDGLDTHKIVHQRLLSQLQTFAKEFSAKKTVSPEFFSFLKVWLSGHIRGIDMKYAKKSKAA